MDTECEEAYDFLIVCHKCFFSSEGYDRVIER